MNTKMITDKFCDNKMLWCVCLLALATVLSFFPILVLEEGGSWTFFSLLMLWLVTYFFGLKTGLIGSFLFSLLKFAATFVSEVVLTGRLAESGSVEMIRNNLFIHPAVFLLEYTIACTCFCLGALLPSNRRCAKYIKSYQKGRIRNSENETEKDPALPIMVYGDLEKENSTSGLIFGYLIGVFIMFVCYVAAAPFYDSYPEGVTTTLQRLMYDIKYDGSYLFTEAATTVFVLLLPPVRRVIFQCKHIANNPKQDASFFSY